MVTHEREALRISGARLDQELVSPTIQGLETLRVIDVVDEHAAVGAPVERNTQGLEAFLARGIPNLHVHKNNVCVNRPFFPTDNK